MSVSPGWLQENGIERGHGPDPRREPRGSRGRLQKCPSESVAGTDADRFWNPLPWSRPKRAARPVFALPFADQLELWPKQSLETFIQRNVESAATRAAEKERQGEAETPKLGRMERKRIGG